MKKHLLFLAFVLGGLPASAQQSAVLDVNNVRGPVLSNSFLWNQLNFSGGLEVPKAPAGQPARKSVFVANLWLGGVDATGFVYTAAETYRQGGDIGFWPGPLTTAGVPLTGGTATYDHVWRLTRAQITTHRASYAQPGYQAPADLLGWPAATLTLPNIGPAAPFVDLNGNSLYEPLSGEYPDVPGDDNLLFIVNDVAGIKEPYCPPMGVQVTGLVYAYAPGTAGGLLDNMVFVRYQLANKGNKTFQDMRLGHWVDFDLGNWNDDYVASDTTRQMMYAYNGDALDADTTTNRVTTYGYGIHPPAQAVTVLNRPMRGAMFYQNDFSVYGNPTAAPHYNYYLNSKWLSGQPLRYGGAGTGSASPATRFMYSGDPVAATGWTEASANRHRGDRRGLMSMDVSPVTLLFGPGQVETFDLAYVFAQDQVATQNPHLASVTALNQLVDQVRGLYQNGTLATAAELAAAGSLRLFPNPAHHTVRVSGLQGEILQLRDALGRLVREQAVPAAETTLDLRGLPTGLYFIRCGSATRRLVIE